MEPNVLSDGDHILPGAEHLSPPWKSVGFEGSQVCNED